jgi:hypothetical protein
MLCFVPMSARAEFVTRIRQFPRYPFVIRGPERVRTLINRPVLRWTDPSPEELRADATRVFITGHLVDKPGQSLRFPDTAEAVAAAEAEIHTKLENIYQTTRQQQKPLELLLCSAAAGTDLLTLEWALNKKASDPSAEIIIRTFLPYNVDSFTTNSVDYGEHADRWMSTFTKLQAMGVVVEPQFKNRIEKRRTDEFTRPTIDRQIQRRYGSHAGHYTAYDELNDKMVGYLRRGDYVLALWDGKAPRKRGGTLDALYKAYKRVGDPQHIMFIEDSNNIVLPNKAPYREGEQGRTIFEAIALRAQIRNGNNQ